MKERGKDSSLFERHYAETIAEGVGNLGYDLERGAALGRERPAGVRALDSYPGRDLGHLFPGASNIPEGDADKVRAVFLEYSLEIPDYVLPGLKIEFAMNKLASGRSYTAATE
jgi:hypothetical protein